MASERNAFSRTQWRLVGDHPLSQLRWVDGQLQSARRVRRPEESYFEVVGDSRIKCESQPSQIVIGRRGQFNRASVNGINHNIHKFPYIKELAQDKAIASVSNGQTVRAIQITKMWPVSRFLLLPESAARTETLLSRTSSASSNASKGLRCGKYKCFKHKRILLWKNSPEATRSQALRTHLNSRMDLEGNLRRTSTKKCVGLFLLRKYMNT